ncbi:MAG: DUF1800 family protein [Phycisphaerae bacterium]
MRCSIRWFSAALAFSPGVAFAGDLAPAKTWNVQRAGHLLRRTGFGGTPEGVLALYRMGLTQAVDALLTPDPPAEPADVFPCSQVEHPQKLRRFLREQLEPQRRAIRQQLRSVDQGELAMLRAWWLRRMVETPDPFREKMTLFWHGHFTTGAQEVHATRLIAEQNELLRKLSTERFGDLLRGICRNPAMLRYLDNVSNRKQHPNENFARELLELFTLGAGHYTETDIQEAARALTGWTFDEEGFRFRRSWHDDGIKTFLGKTGRLDGDDIIRIILEQPATAEHLARKLVLFFVRDDPPEALVHGLADSLRRTDFDIRASMRTLFVSEAFYQSAVNTHIKSPVELVVGTLRSLRYRNVDYFAMSEQLRSMGQVLFQPPNVKGWDGGRKWISSATVFRRRQFLGSLLTPPPQRAVERRRNKIKKLARIKKELQERLPDDIGLHVSPGPSESIQGVPFDPTTLLAGKNQWRVGDAVDRLADVLLQRPLSTDQRRRLIGILGTPAETIPVNRGQSRRRLKPLMRAMAALPEFQLD